MWRTIKRHFSNDPWKTSEFTTRRVVENALPLVKTSTACFRPLGRNKASAPMQQSQGETEKSLNRLNSTNLPVVQQTKLFVFTIKKGIPQTNETLLREDGNTREGFTFLGLRWKNASRELSTLLLRNVCTALNRNALATPTRPLAGHASRRRQILFEFRVHTRH